MACDNLPYLWELTGVWVQRHDCKDLVTIYSTSPQISCMACPIWKLTVVWLQRHDCKDLVTIYSTKTWKPEVAIAVPTSDLADLAWSPDNCCLLVWDSALTYKALVYASDGDLLASYQAYSDALGIRSTCWSPSGQMLAIGSFDQVVSNPKVAQR